MKKITLLIISYILLCPSLCWTQMPENEYYPNGEVKVDWRSEYNDNDFTMKEYYPDGKLMSEATYIDGKISGIYRKYDTNGNILVETNYFKGLEHGLFRQYSANGSLLKEENYKNGKKNGLEKIYDNNGHLYQEIEYANNIRRGAARIYYPGGVIKESFHYFQGEISGPAKFYYNTGTLKAESYYNEDVRQGAAKEYYENGQLHFEMEFVNDHVDGQFIEYYENGKIKILDTIADGEIIGHKAYNEAGVLTEEFPLNTDKSGKGLEHVFENLSEKNFMGAMKELFRFLIEIKGGIAIVALLIISLIIGIFIGNVLQANAKEDRAFEQSATIKPDLIHNRKEFNALHPESEKMYRKLVETVKSGIFMSDVNGNLFYVNNTFVQLFGYKTKQEVTGLNLNDKFKSFDHEEKQLLKIMGESNDIYDFQFKYQLPDSTMVVLSASANRIFDESGKPIGLQGVVVDITEKSRLEEDVLNEKRKLESLLAFFEDIDTVHDLKTLVDYSVKGIADILESYTCIVMLKDPETHVLKMQGAKGLDSNIHVGSKDQILKEVLKTRKALFVENIEYDKRFHHDTKPPYLKRSFVIVPLESQDSVNGIVIVTDKRSRFKVDIPFNETDLKILTIVTGKISIAIENIKLYSELNLQTVIDPITKIYNYRLLSESLDREIQRVERENGEFSILMMDVDDFKSYNDTFGHLEGDELLINLGIILNTHVRKMDIVCRYAGDEFCIVLTNASSERAVSPAEKIIKAVEAFPFKKTVTISIGISDYEKGMTKKELISKADKALYQAKHEGKNKIVVSS